MGRNLLAASSADPGIAMHFQARDEDILNTMHRYGGVLARRQLKELFWPDKTWRAMEKRLAKLHQGQYLAWPTQEDRREHPIPEPVCWVGWKGAVLLAGTADADRAMSSATSENRQRKIEQVLRRSGFHWTREPRWLQLKHDLLAVDFRLAVERAIRQTPALTLATWVVEREFRANPDVIDYEVQTAGGSRRRMRKAIIPDGFFSVHDRRRLAGGRHDTARLLVEIDMSTEDTPRIARDKLEPGAAYLRSSQYEQRFGCKSGRWLVVVQSAPRLRHLLRQASSTLGQDASLFYFTTQESLLSGNVLFSSIWHCADDQPALPLFQE